MAEVAHVSRAGSVVTETTIEQHLLDQVRALGGLCIKLAAPSDAGWPDRVVLLPRGIFGFIELKRPRKEPTKLQFYRLGQLRRLGFVAAWADTFVGVDAFLERLG